MLGKLQRAWINPIGGLGDGLMLSGVLKLAVEQSPRMRWNLVRRTRYQWILAGHPAIEQIGFPPSDAQILRTDYWSMEALGAGTQRAFQILARAFGLPTPIEERLYMPPATDSDSGLWDDLPFGADKVVLIAPSSASPRKMAPHRLWEQVASALAEAGCFVIHVGPPDCSHVQGAYSLVGVTSPRDLVVLVDRCDLLITVDNYLMHVAHLTGTPAIVLWGPTDPDVYGYAGQIHLRGARHLCPRQDSCLGPQYPENYGCPCPRPESHCTGTHSHGRVLDAVTTIMAGLSRGDAAAGGDRDIAEVP